MGITTAEFVVVWVVSIEEILGEVVVGVVSGEERDGSVVLS